MTFEQPSALLPRLSGRVSLVASRLLLGKVKDHPRRALQPCGFGNLALSFEFRLAGDGGEKFLLFALAVLFSLPLSLLLQPLLLFFLAGEPCLMDRLAFCRKRRSPRILKPWPGFQLFDQSRFSRGRCFDPVRKICVVESTQESSCVRDAFVRGVDKGDMSRSQPK